MGQQHQSFQNSLSLSFLIQKGDDESRCVPKQTPAAGVCACVSSVRLHTAFLHQTLLLQTLHYTIERKTNTLSVKQIKSDVLVRCLLTRKHCLLNCLIKQHAVR